jgi:hypothetical protein
MKYPSLLFLSPSLIGELVCVISWLKIYKDDFTLLFPLFSSSPLFGELVFGISWLEI